MRLVLRVVLSSSAVAAKYYGAAPGLDIATGVGCWVRLVKQGLPNVCWPDANISRTWYRVMCSEHGTWCDVANMAPFTKLTEHHKANAFGCKENTANTVLVAGMCRGLFQCANGATADCQLHRECKCDGNPAPGGESDPCHLNYYTRGGHCPPALPFPPSPPPRPMHPPSLPAHVAHCDRLCHEALAHRAKDSWCKCSACRGGNVTDRFYSVDEVVMQKIASGVPCYEGHLMHNRTHDLKHNRVVTVKL